MTPLAEKLQKYINKHGAIPYVWSFTPGGVQPFDCKQFDVTEIMPIVEDLLTKGETTLDDMVKNSNQLFLPYPNTWLEWKEENLWYAWCLQEQLDKSIKMTTFVEGNLPGNPPIGMTFGYFNYPDIEQTGKYLRYAVPVEIYNLPPPSSGAPRPFDVFAKAATKILAALILVNTPRLFKAEKRIGSATLIKKSPKYSTYRKEGWIQIKLSVATPSQVDGSGAIVHGQKCLHMCRQHLRFRKGRVE